MVKFLWVIVFFMGTDASACRMVCGGTEEHPSLVILCDGQERGSYSVIVDSETRAEGLRCRFDRQNPFISFCSTEENRDPRFIVETIPRVQRGSRCLRHTLDFLIWAIDRRGRPIPELSHRYQFDQHASRAQCAVNAQR